LYGVKWEGGEHRGFVVFEGFELRKLFELRVVGGIRWLKKTAQCTAS